MNLFIFICKIYIIYNHIIIDIFNDKENIISFKDFEVGLTLEFRLIIMEKIEFEIRGRTPLFLLRTFQNKMTL